MVQVEEEGTQGGHPPGTTTPWALDDLPPFPAVATRLAQLLFREEVDITEAGRMVAADPSFANRLLQLANSPLFALERQVRTISHAIVVLGVQRLKSITLTRVLGDFVGPTLKTAALRLCWRNSLAGAIISERLARACKLNPDFAYTAGLLRDIGRLGLLVKYPESYANLLAVTGENAFDLIASERELFDIDHCAAGAWMMETLPFPPEFREVAARHHDPPSGPFRTLHLVRIADRMADTLGFPVLAPAVPLSVEEVLAELPEQARSRVDADPETMKAEVNSRIQAWS
jgi:HD-like signal output (HDOD) protein